MIVDGGGPYAKVGSNPVVTVTGNVTYVNGTGISSSVNITITKDGVVQTSGNITSNNIGSFYNVYSSSFDTGTYIVNATTSYGGFTISNTSTFAVTSTSGICQTQDLSLSAIAYDASTGNVVSTGTSKLIIQETGDEKDVAFTNGIWSATFSTCLTSGSQYHLLVKIVDSTGISSSSVLVFRAP